MKVAQHLDKVGSIGAIVAASFAPCCFPFLGVMAATLGLGALVQFAPQLQYAIQVLVAVALAGSCFAYLSHRLVWPLTIAVVGTFLIFFHYYATFSTPLVYTGFGLLLLSGAWNTVLNTKRKRSKAILESTITCPECGFQKIEKMPTNACQFFWNCPNCGKMLKPKEGDCCVFCSYGTIPCPPIQL